MLEVAGYQVFCRCSLRTFKKDIIVGIGACLYRIRRPDPMAVFANRLRVGMPLQTDPTVIYGMGDSYTGRIRKKDLQTDTPYNTYTRMGLPPTPISLPGVASLQAAMNPAQSTALYFVSRGDGSSIFSDTLGDHNKAVDKYIRGQ